MANDALRRIDLGGAVLTLFLGVEDDEATLDSVDALVTYPDGSRFAATILTLAALDKVMRGHEATGECLGGRYFQSHDLVVMRRGGLDEIVELVRKLIEKDELRHTFAGLEPDLD
ncbi:hypothetical protein AB0J80_10005 [Actinoplanes sp. NPDC049548]|uniref:hypothetical protein n=1 Tax=Actinoplanes sp. NPDC049548 TaxID=3155152 RepID=UPI0034379A87